MEISVIIPVYNRANIVKRTLDSVLNQSHRPIHLILVDNNSTDNTMCILQDYKSKHEKDDFKITVTIEQKKGAAAARNCGLEIAKSEWIMFFDSDDVMDNYLIARYVQEINHAKNNLDIVMCRVDIISENGKRKTMPLRSGNLLRNHIYHSILSTQRYIVRREFLISAGAWNEELPGWNDMELGVRLLLLNPRIVSIIDCIPVHIYSQAESITGCDYASKSHLWELSLDHAEQAVRQVAPPYMQSILTLLEYKRLTLAGLYTLEGSSKGKKLYKIVYARVRREPHLSWAFPLIYHYISIGGRGSSRLIDILV